MTRRKVWIVVGWQIREIEVEIRTTAQGDVAFEVEGGLAIAPRMFWWETSREAEKALGFYLERFASACDRELARDTNGKMRSRLSLKAADAEDAAGSVSVGGLAADLGMYQAQTDPAPGLFDDPADAEVDAAVDVWLTTPGEKFGTSMRQVLKGFTEGRRKAAAESPGPTLAAINRSALGPEPDPEPSEQPDLVVTVADRFASAIRPTIEGVLGFFGFSRRSDRQA